MAETVEIGKVSGQLTKASRVVVTTDGFWVQTGEGQSVLIPAEYVRAYLNEGLTPQMRAGDTGLQVSYDGGTTWAQVATWDEMSATVASLEAEYQKITESEASRVEAETSRESAEATRQSTFEANEKQRQSDYETAEGNRNSDYESRVSGYVGEVETAADEAKSTISGLVNGLDVTQETGDDTTKVMSQAAVTEALEKAPSMKFRRGLRPSDIVATYENLYWTKDGVATTGTKGTQAVLLRAPSEGAVLHWPCNNYNQWQVAWLCDGVGDDNTISNGTLCTDKAIDPTGHKYVLLTEARDGAMTISTSYDSIVDRPGTCWWEETLEGAEAVKRAAEDEWQAKTFVEGWAAGSVPSVSTDWEAVAKRLGVEAESRYKGAYGQMRRVPYFTATVAPMFNCFVNLEEVEIGDYPGAAHQFEQCRNLVSVKGIEDWGITQIYQSQFMGCSALALTELPSGVTSIGGSAFNGCSSLALTELPSGVTEIGGGAFNGCSSLALTELPEGLTEIGNQVFSGTSLANECTFPASIKAIGQQNFGRDVVLTMKGSTPPTICGGNSANYGFFIQSRRNPVIYVPDDAVDTYKAADGWSTYADYIKGVSEK